MSIANPLTAGTDIQKANITVNKSSESNNIISTVSVANANNKFGAFSQDVVNISRLGREKQQAEQVFSVTGLTSNNSPINALNKNSSKQNEVKSNDSITVSSSIGRSQSAGSLTRERASALYNAIAALL